MKNVRSKLQKMLFEIGALEKQPCTPEENDKFIDSKDNNQPVPDDVFEDYLGKWNRLVKNDLSQQELDLFIKLKQTKLLMEIKDCLVIIIIFLTIGFILSIII